MSDWKIDKRITRYLAGSMYNLSSKCKEATTWEHTQPECMYLLHVQSKALRTGRIWNCQVSIELT
jgi:hypothetical protein